MGKEPGIEEHPRVIERDVAEDPVEAMLAVIATKGLEQALGTASLVDIDAAVVLFGLRAGVFEELDDDRQGAVGRHVDRLDGDDRV